MCRYGLIKYKSRLACFACRKAFRRRLKADVDPEGEEHGPVCPQCAQPMVELGIDFRPPPTSARKKWAAVASLWRAGITFHSCGCGGPGWRPAETGALRAFLEEQRAQALAQCAAWRAKRGPDRGNATAHFTQQAARIERELALLSRRGSAPTLPRGSSREGRGGRASPRGRGAR